MTDKIDEKNSSLESFKKVNEWLRFGLQKIRAAERALDQRKQKPSD